MGYDPFDPCHPWNDRRIEEVDRLLRRGEYGDIDGINSYQKNTGKCGYCNGKGNCNPIGRDDTAFKCSKCEGTGLATYWPNDNDVRW